jgi:predicted HTH domain antitoxin
MRIYQNLGRFCIENLIKKRKNALICIMKTLKITLPDNIDLDKREAVLIIASKMFEKGILSLGQAAKMASISTRDFMEVTFNYNVSLFNYNTADLNKDVANAKKYRLLAKNQITSK